ncbi:MAG: o-succinylbenzoate synthase [Vagococcus sp.]
MKIKQIDWYDIRLPLVVPFQTRYGTLFDKACAILVVTDELGHTGLGELVTLESPYYIQETFETSRMIAKTWLIPMLKNRDIGHPDDISTFFREVKGNPMAKSCLETAIWDVYGRRHGQPLTDYFGDTTSHVSVGVSVGIEPDLDILETTVREYLQEGYSRVKLKIKPGYDVAPVARIRRVFPELELMVDANSAYTEVDIPHLLSLDAFDLAMIEQPFGATDYLTHRELQRQMTTCVCLDENIQSLTDIELAYELKSCQSINLKIPRVGGITEALAITRFCEQREILVWMGGMYESGVGRALNLQFASQKAFTFPGDISQSSRYFHEDVIESPFKLEDGKITVPTESGIGVDIDEEMVAKYCVEKETFYL